MTKPDIVQTLEREGFQIHGNKTTCSFHYPDTRPSLHVFRKTNSFYCFSCGIGGDSIAFIMKLRGLSFKEALKYLSIDDHRPQEISGVEAQNIRLVSEFRQWEQRYLTELCAMYRAIQRHKKSVHCMNDVSMSAYHAEPLLEHRLDTLTYGNDKAKFGLFQEVMNDGR